MTVEVGTGIIGYAKILRISKPFMYIYSFYHFSHYVLLPEFLQQRSCFAFGLHWSVYFVPVSAVHHFVYVFHLKISLPSFLYFLSHISYYSLYLAKLRARHPRSSPTPATTSPTAVTCGLSRHWRTKVYVTWEQTFIEVWDLGHGRTLITIIILFIISLFHLYVKMYKMKRFFLF